MEYIEDWNSFRKSLQKDPRIARILIGVTKEELRQKFQLQKNSTDNDVWHYRISSKFSFHNPNYLYLQFQNNKVVQYRLRRYPLFSKRRHQFMNMVS